MMIFKKLILFILVIGISFPVFSQKKGQAGLSKRFDDADYDFVLEDYYSALTQYLYILKFDSSNANVNYLIGVCYMKTKFERKKGIPYLERAVKKVTNKYEEGTFEEKRANLDAYLYLGQAYRINNEIDKAIEAFNSYKKLLPAKDKKNHFIVDSEIEACRNAKKEIKTFASVKMLPIPELNTPVSDYNPVVSADESVIVFANQQLEGRVNEEKRILFSKKVNKKWIKPVDITNNLKTNDNMLPTYLSPDGKYMLLAENDDSRTTLYESKFITTKRDSGTWTAVKKLNRNINTGKVTHASLSPDGKTIYFTSEKKGGLGGLDIYKSVKDKNGDWGPAENLGPKINTPQDEESPFLTPANILFFASGGHGSIGGLDLFRSALNEKGQWSDPVSLGYMFNTTDDDYFYFPLEDGSKGYMSMLGEDNSGEKDIYKVEIISEGGLQTTPMDNLMNVEDKKIDLKSDTASKEFKIQKEEKKDDVKTDVKVEEKTNTKTETKVVFSPKFTIHLSSSKTVKDPGIFSKLKGVKQLKCKDGNYKYVYGEFPDQAAAKKELTKIQAKGFKTAVVVDFDKFKATNFEAGNIEGCIIDVVQKAKTDTTPKDTKTNTKTGTKTNTKTGTKTNTKTGTKTNTKTGTKTDTKTDTKKTTTTNTKKGTTTNVKTDKNQKK